MKSVFRFLLIVLFIIILSGLYYFNFRDNKNNSKLNQAAQINEKLDIDNTGIQKSELRILFTGDIMLDRHIRRSVNRLGLENFIRDYIGELVESNKKYDLVIANLEGPITGEQTLTVTEEGKLTQAMHFTFDPAQSKSVLEALNVRAVSLANNHTDNFYYAGYISTRKYLDEAKIVAFGNPYNSNDEGLSSVICEKSICLALIGYNQFTRENDSVRIVEEIENLNIKKVNGEVDYIFVMPHWGEEYKSSPSATQIRLAREWIDAGADAVVGMHSHVIGEIEEYKGKRIYYSLGNYIFDQWFSEDVRAGLQVPIILSKEIISKNADDKGGDNVKSTKSMVNRSMQYADNEHTYISRDKIEKIDR